MANWHHPHMNECKLIWRCCKSSDCQRRYLWEIWALSIFCLQCFRISVLGWKTQFNCKTLSRGPGNSGPSASSPNVNIAAFPWGKERRDASTLKGQTPAAHFPVTKCPPTALHSPELSPQWVFLHSVGNEKQNTECLKVWAQQGEKQKQTSHKKNK